VIDSIQCLFKNIFSHCVAETFFLIAPGRFGVWDIWILGVISSPVLISDPRVLSRELTALIKQG
jgi:hypothetical protein